MLRARLVAVLTGAALCLQAVPAAALEFEVLGRRLTLDLSWTTLFHYHHDNENDELENQKHEDDFYEDLQSRLNLLLATGPWSAGLRFDVLIFTDLYPERRTGAFRYDNLARPGTTVPNDLQLAPYLFEKLWARYADGTFDVTLGDFYATFGRGLTLSVRKMDELGVDTTIRGARFQAALGAVDLELLGGLVNPANLETSKELLIRDPDDLVAGARIAVQPVDGLTVAVSGVYAGLYYADGGDPRVDNLLAGADLEALGLLNGKLDLFVEGVYQGRDPFDQLGKQSIDHDAGHGYGLYGGVVLYLEPVTITLEIKDYNQFYLVDERLEMNVDPRPTPIGDYQPGPTWVDTPLFLHAPPTFEREDQEVPLHFNALGGRLKAEVHVAPLGLDLAASYLLYWVDDQVTLGTERFAHDRRIYHLFLSAERAWSRGGQITVSGGFREDHVNAPEGADSLLEQQLGHAELDLRLPVSGRHNLGLAVRHEEEFKSQAGRFREGDVALEYGWSPHLALGATFDYTTHRFYVDQGHDWKPYGGGYISLRHSRPGSTASLRLFGGGRRGGQRCIGGQCRIYPPFVGLELTATIRY